MPFFATGGIGIDLGSASVAIYLAGERTIALREPSAVLVSAANAQDVLAVGADARAMSGRTGIDTELISPILHGAVADVDLAALMMVALTEKATGRKKPMEKALLVASAPGGATRVEQAALFQAMLGTGAKRMAAVKAPVAAALGAGVDIAQPRGKLFVTIGGGYVEIALLSMNGIVALRMIRFGGEDMDEAIVRWFWREKGVVIGLRTAEQLKREVGTARKGENTNEEQVLLKGKDAKTGKPAEILVSGQDVRAALDETILRIVDAMKNALFHVPPDLSADVHEHGIYLTGGGALLDGLGARLERETGVATVVSEHPQDDACLGLGMIASDERLLAALRKTGAVDLAGD